MGFLGLGDPYEWEASRDDDIIKYIREHGIEQFVAMWNKVKDINNDSLKWGDEIEYGILSADLQLGTVRCSLRGAEILAALKRSEQASPDSEEGKPAVGGCEWVPEYGAWMVEGTPAEPYTGFASDLLCVERNMRRRRARLLNVLKPDEICPTIPCFPLLGVGQWTTPPQPTGGPVSESLFISDGCINPHPRFAALTGNIRRRRGSRVDIRMPRFQDRNTPAPVLPKGCPAPESAAAALGMDEVYMDAMAFGMGCCCLQVTFQAREVSESRHLYDQLAVLAPILLALTAATPAARGVLLDTDSRWDLISQSVDDRTPTERGVEGENGGDTNAKAGAGIYHPAMAAGGKARQIKSRYASISQYICESLGSLEPCASKLNDISAPYDPAVCERLQAAGCDALLSRHVAHLFSRDPLVIFRGRTQEIDDAESTEHFENLQSTNWQTVRWKPPPASSRRLGGTADIGWRVEFRSMEVQMTDFENAAFTVFIVLTSRVILYFDLNLYLPLSKVDENMRRAQGRDALLKEKFWFCQSLMPTDGDCPGAHLFRARDKLEPALKQGVGEMQEGQVSVLEILQGKGSYKGLVPMILTYLDIIGTDSITLRTVSSYLDFIVARAAGELMTPAAWMREYVRSHPDYKFDSVVSSRIAADLMAKCHRIGQGLEKVPELYGDFHIEPVVAKDAFPAKLLSDMPLQKSTSTMGRTMEKYSQRSELIARKRQLQNELDEQRRVIQRTEDDLQKVQADLASLAESSGLPAPTPLSNLTSARKSLDRNLDHLDDTANERA